MATLAASRRRMYDKLRELLCIRSGVKYRLSIDVRQEIPGLQSSFEFILSFSNRFRNPRLPHYVIHYSLGDTPRHI
jgi:hypothetical protein